VRKLRCAWTSSKPTPFTVATISEMTIRMTAIERLMRSPAKIFGAAAGRTIRVSASNRTMR
jgi:hypothetical protein